jgi:Ca-activated chloride channel family protein
MIDLIDAAPLARDPEAPRKRATTRVLLALVVLAGAVSDGEPAPQADSVASGFRAGIDVVSLNVTVTDSEQPFVSDLTQNDFTVLDNGVRQPIRYFAKTGGPLSIALLLDTSSSMRDALPIAQEAAIGFVRQIGDGDLVSVVDFETRVEISQTLTHDVPALERAITSARVGGGTSLYNALDLALQELSRPAPVGEPAGARRRVIVVLSDGEDTSSSVRFDQVLDRAVRTDTIVYGVGLGLGRQPASRPDGESGELILRRLAQQTGGRAFFTDDVRELAGFYGRIRDELANQYLLSYEFAGVRDGTWRRIQVRVKRPHTTARTRAGYFAVARER